MGSLDNCHDNDGDHTPGHPAPKGKEAKYDASKDPAAILLEKAQAIVTGARRKAYGTPEDNFKVIAMLWGAYMTRKCAIAGGATEFTAADVAAMMALVKIARLAETPDHADSWIDIAGYAACGARASKADLK